MNLVVKNWQFGMGSVLREYQLMDHLMSKPSFVGGGGEIRRFILFLKGICPKVNVITWQVCIHYVTVQHGSHYTMPPPPPNFWYEFT